MSQTHIQIFPSPKYDRIPSPSEASASASPASSWRGEYIYSGVCLAAASLLVLLMYIFDGQPEPRWNSNLQYSTVIIAIMTCFRLALKAVLESCISQGAWIWVSGFRKGSVEAKIEDFKMFDEAATGLWGSLVLIWRMRGRHLACVGAAIMILAQGFETFSSGMVGFDESPTQVSIPSPPRAETYLGVLPDGKGGDISLGLSTKAAIYDGIIAETIPPVAVSCPTLDCTWPPFPTLAVCGKCSESHFQTACNSQNGCAYTMPSGTSVSHQDGLDSGFRFKVAPTNGSTNTFASDSQPYISIFDMISVPQKFSETIVQAHECALWFCLQSFNVTVANGVQTSIMISNWSTTHFSMESNIQSDEVIFTDTPPNLYVHNQSRYSIPADSIQALRSFINPLITGNASGPADAIQYSSDWIEAIWNATPHLDFWIARLALSITNEIRRTGTLNTPTISENTNKTLAYTGTASTTTSHVRVNWYWVIYPLTLMILAFCYLAQTVWRTARDQVCAWKGDSLPMLFCHVEPGVYAQVQDGMDVPEGLVGRVGKIEVELVRRDDGLWVFREPINH
ncbi:uncharacterized protein GGS22DRAFT_191401 [Annulohypoxylon maeteangense]|uniref:uncharacterized protein n=1 Tax=Annulohypoxylon maeteangense TaxID=1927788 RepID=UPI002007A41B|nr:uncharacterized protein GGS22DRAFT_191401 [Annulohypoxylon maeteangense]KAI0882231.1 hypothetical protein GGS22DRAFT_191401 [Annulohypoxylon maeteangense]